MVEGTEYTCSDAGTVNVNTNNYAGTVTCPAVMADFCDSSRFIYECGEACFLGNGVCLSNSSCIEFEEYDHTEYD